MYASPNGVVSLEGIASNSEICKITGDIMRDGYIELYYKSHE